VNGKETYFPTLGEALATNRRFTGLAVRDIGMLASALGRPKATVFGQDAYPDIWSKAAALKHSIIRNHPFLDANKRTGTALTLAFLDRNGVDVTAADHDSLVAIPVAIANADLDVGRIAGFLRRAIEDGEAIDARELS
jgi:death-on-curing protein